jgi:chromosome segregation ATPase
VNKFLEDASKLKRKHTALEANKFIANKSLEAKTAAYNKLMDQHKHLKKEKVQVESKLEEYKDQEGDATQERPRLESV